jgi:hypothetical protein
VLVHRGDQREAIRNADLIGRERKTKVGLGEGGDSGAKGRSKSMSQGIRHSNRQKGGFVVVNGEACCLLENLQHLFGLQDCLRRAVKEDEHVIGVLEDGARSIRSERMFERGRAVRVMEKTTEHICYNDEEIRGHRVTLA